MQTVVNAFTAATLQPNGLQFTRKPFGRFLDQFGIDPQKEGEVYDVAGADERRIRPTGGWFYLPVN